MKDEIKVMIVDDSAFMRKVISDILGTAKTPVQINVVATARNGIDALKLYEGTRPDVITLDIEMPKMNGLEFLGEFWGRHHGATTKIIILSANTPVDARSTIRSIVELGAFDFIQKPSGNVSFDIESVGEDLVRKILLAGDVSIDEKLVFLQDSRELPKIMTEIQAKAPQYPMRPKQGKFTVLSKERLLREPAPRAVAFIASSTGGPKSLMKVLAAIPASFKWPIVIVQHMPEGFTASLAERLNEVAYIMVKEAADGDVLHGGFAYLAPGNKHMAIATKIIGGKTRHVVKLTEEPRVMNLRPCANYTLTSLHATFDRIAVAVLTGMGNDGLASIQRLKDDPGTRSFVVTQDESTSIVYGMPKAVFDAGFSDKVVPIYQIAGALVEGMMLVDKDESYYDENKDTLVLETTHDA